MRRRKVHGRKQTRAGGDSPPLAYPANVRIYTDYMPYSDCKPCSELPSLVMRADGTIDRYAYSAGEYEPGANGAAGVFTDSGIGEGDWFRTVVTHYAAGDVEIPNVTTRDVKIEIRSSKRTLLQEQYVCTAPGEYARVSCGGGKGQRLLT